MLGKEFEFHGSFSVSKYATKMSGSSDVLNDESHQIQNYLLMTKQALDKARLTW